MNNMLIEITSFNEIKALHPNQWVLLADPEIEDAEVLGGNVLFHSTDKRAVLDFAQRVIGQHGMVKIVFTGEMPKVSRLGIFKVTEN